MKLRPYASFVKFQQWRARLLPEGLKHRYWECLSRKSAQNYTDKMRGTPEAFFFETRTRCNSLCEFCPANASLDKRDDSYMPRETFEKCIDEIADISFDGLIGFW